jgi:transcriptional regulator with XRE-family HTH domain
MGNLHPLARLRGRRGWSGRDLARAADVADETVSRIENGLMPSPRTIYKLAAALEMDFDELADLLTEEPDEVSAS